MPCACWCALWLLAPLTAGAQQLSIAAGASDADDHTNTTYTWQLQYLQSFQPHFAASLDWINEGHLQTHRRDGAATQVWLVSSPWHRLHAAVGLGPYFYFDTEPNDDARGYLDRHAVGALASADVAWDASGPWAFHVTLNQIMTPGDVSTRSLLLGVSYAFAEPGSEFSAREEARVRPVYRQQLQLFGGQSTLNSLNVESTPTWGVDYQFAVSKWLAGAATYFRATQWWHTPPNRIAAQVRVEHRIDDTPLSFGAGIGAYAALGGTSGGPSDQQRPYSGLLLVRSSWQVTRRVGVVANWFRTFTQDDKDLDIIAFGVSYSFGTR